MKILILGAGLVARPMVDYFLSKNYSLTLADMELERAKKLINSRPKGIAIAFNILTEQERLDELIKTHDITVTLLPPNFTPTVVKYSIKNKKNLVATNYVAPETKALDSEAKKAGITIINEVGVDPGIDHMIAKKIIDEIHDKGGKVLSFKSYCGGFPAPESNNNPFGYKFSWSPRGVLLASKRSAIYKENGKKIVIPEGEIFGKDYISRLDIPTDSNIGSLEVYANSDSLKYSEIYNIPEAETIFRSTLRYPGWSETIKAIQKLNYLSLEEYTTNCTYSEYLAKLLKCENEDLKSIVAKKLEINLQHDIMERLEWLGIFSNAKNISKNQNMAPLDVLTELMINKMTYKEKEKDVLVLVNEFVAQNSDSSKQKITASLIEYGEFGKYTAMAKTVSYPASICTELLLANKIKAKGVVIPTDKEIYLPVLEELQTNLGLKIETVYKNLK